MTAYPAKERRRRALERLVARLERRSAALARRAERLSWARLLTFVAGFAASGALFFLRGPGFWIPAVAVWLLLFGLVVGVHRRLDMALRRHRLWREIKLAHLARMALDWEAIGLPPDVPVPGSEHPFALDLDLLGPRSLRHLIDVAVSSGGSERLTSWLLDAAPEAETTLRRQALVQELVPRSRFRDGLQLQARVAQPEEGASEPAARLQRWLAHKEAPRSQRPLLLVLGALAVANIVLFVAAQWGGLPPWWRATFTVYGLLYLTLGRAAGELFPEALALQAALRQAGAVFRHLEEARLPEGSELSLLCDVFRRGERPSVYVRRVNRIVKAAGLAANPVLALALNAVVPWNLFLAERLEHWRGELARRLPGWLDVWHDLEALGSLANLAYLNPHYAFPSLAPAGVPFAGEQLGHPLLPDDVKVRNDFAIPALGSVDIITGSNMAGKSSFLRTLGVNLVLAYAGGPVDAAALETTVFRPFSSIRLTDSVTDGISYFYAEVQRLKALLAALRRPDERPLFFLIDEIFRGTNNRERLIGSRAYVEALSGSHGVGVVATHDLELVQLAQALPAVRNFHFRDEIAGDRMVFDYRLRPGPSPTTNALKIMEQAGLPVPADQTSDLSEKSDVSR